MKKLIIFIIILGIAAFLTNPTKTDYQEWEKNELAKQASSGLEKTVTNIFSENFLNGLTVRQDYYVCSIFTTQFLDTKIRTLGVFKKFFILNSNEK